MLNPRAVALQGIGFTAALVAVQGFALVVTPTGRRPRSNARFTPYREEPTVSLQMLREEDSLVTDLIVALVTKGFFYGTPTS